MKLQNQFGSENNVFQDHYRSALNKFETMKSEFDDLKQVRTC